jgi:hypothetical protein
MKQFEQFEKKNNGLGIGKAAYYRHYLKMCSVFCPLSKFINP